MDCGRSPVVLGQRPNEAQTVVNADALSSGDISRAAGPFQAIGGGVLKISAESHHGALQNCVFFFLLPAIYVQHFLSILFKTQRPELTLESTLLSFQKNHPYMVFTHVSFWHQYLFLYQLHDLPFSQHRQRMETQSGKT